MLVIDPGLYRVGFDPFTGNEVIDIPGATYSGPDTKPKVEIPDLLPGQYGLTVIGTRTGTFEITFEVLSEDGTVLSSRGVSGTVMAGEHLWSIFHMGDEKEFDPIVLLSDSTPPSCLSEVALPDTIRLTLQDPESGLAALNIDAAGNADGIIPPFNVGTNDPYFLTATKFDPSDAAKIQLRVADVAGNISSCGAVLAVVDIKPGSDPNSINLGSDGLIPVAILTTATFDAADVDQPSLTLEGGHSKVKAHSENIGSFEDVDGDGDLDLVVQFPTADLQLTEADTEAILEGLSLDGTLIVGFGAVIVVP